MSNSRERVKLNCKLHGVAPHREQGKGGLSNPLSHQFWSSHRTAPDNSVVESPPSLLREELLWFAKREKLRESKKTKRESLKGFWLSVCVKGFCNRAKISLTRFLLF